MNIGFAMCGSYCTHKKALEQLEKLVFIDQIQPIMSENVFSVDTHFGSAEALRERVKSLCGKEIIHTVVEAEPLGPKTHKKSPFCISIVKLSTTSLFLYPNLTFLKLIRDIIQSPPSKP
jgi:hypothetical protein